MSTDQKNNKFIVGIAAIISVALVLAFYGWMLMLAVGIASSNLGWPPHTIGFYPAVGLSSALLTFYLLKSDIWK